MGLKEAERVKISDLYKKDKAAPKAERKINKNSLKYGGYAIAVTAIVVAVAVGVNVLFAALAKRVNLDIDISLSGTNTLSDENIAFIKDLDTEVTIKVCADKDEYLDLLYEVASSYYGVSQDNTALTYYQQAANFLELYSVYSDKVTLEYADPYDPSFAAVTQEYGDTIMPTDIIVESNQTVDGKEVKRSQIINFDDIFYLQQEGSSYYAYSVLSGSNFESALTSAIYKVTSAETKQALILTPHCTPDEASAYKSQLELNNFEFREDDVKIISEISSDVDLVIISAPTEDFMIEELDAIDEWLYNGGQRGKGLIYLASITSPAMPNLEAYLEEWGIGFSDAVLFETDDNGHLSGDPTSIIFTPSDDETDNDVITALREKAEVMASGGNVPMYQVFEAESLRTTYNLVSTYGDTVVKAPVGSSNEWTPDASYEKARHAGIILTEEASYVNNILCKSYVVAFSSADFVDEYWIAYYTNNAELTLGVAKTAAGAEDDGLSFEMKTTESASFAEAVTEGSSKTISIIFQWAIPLLLIAFGIYVYVRRARR